MRIAGLLVGHVLHTSIFASRCLGALVANPPAVFRHQIHVVASAMPKNHLVFGIIKGHNYIRILVDPPELVPFRIEYQPRVISPELSFSVRYNRQLAPLQIRDGNWRNGCIGALYLSGAERTI